jgi:hypothetical protein
MLEIGLFFNSILCNRMSGCGVRNSLTSVEYLSACQIETIKVVYPAAPMIYAFIGEHEDHTSLFITGLPCELRCGSRFKR